MYACVFLISLEFVSLRPNAFYYHSCIALCTYIIDRVNCVTITVKCMLLHPSTVYSNCCYLLKSGTFSKS